MFAYHLLTITCTHTHIHTLIQHTHSYAHTFTHLYNIHTLVQHTHSYTHTMHTPCTHMPLQGSERSVLDMHGKNEGQLCLLNCTVHVRKLHNTVMAWGLVPTQNSLGTCSSVEPETWSQGDFIVCCLLFFKV